MQKKIKIPKLSLNHVEEAGEVTDYGEEDVELRHSKVLKPFLLFLILFFFSFSFFSLGSTWGLYGRHSLRIPGLLLIPFKRFGEIGSNCGWGRGAHFQSLISVQLNVFLFIPWTQFSCHLRFVQQCSSPLARDALKVTGYVNMEQLLWVALERPRGAGGAALGHPTAAAAEQPN